MKKINQKKDSISFRTEINESLANAIRRSSLEIPILSVDELEIIKNDSPLYDETIAHRVGLIPLKRDSIKNKKSLPILKLKVDSPGYVYSKELIGDVKPVYDNIPITYLTKGQKLEFNAKTIFGTGKQHSKFVPGLIFYRDFLSIKIDKKCPKEIVNLCPKVLELKQDVVTAKEGLDESDYQNCKEISKKFGENLIKISPTKELVIYVESFGQIGVSELFKESIEILKKNLNDLSKLLK